MGDKRYFFSKEIATPERIAAREEKLGEKDRRERERESSCFFRSNFVSRILERILREDPLWTRKHAYTPRVRPRFRRILGFDGNKRTLVYTMEGVFVIPMRYNGMDLGC